MRPRTWFSSLALLAPLVWLFRHALFENECFAFRDSAHYYFPLYKYIQTRWASGLPLWNPLDGIGQPLLGDPTAAVLYPGKLLFLLPLPFATCFVVYIVAHLWLAGLGAHFFARRCNVSFMGAVLAGLAYELSGQVLFQYCNPIFVIGAAWLPWALGFLVVAVKRQEWRAWTLCSISISMMVLGGDPQMAYQVVILGSMLAVTGWYSANADFTFTKTMRVVISAAVFAGLLSAAQILPTLQWSQQSDRSLRNAPRSIAEWSIDKLSGELANEQSGTESDELIGNANAPPLIGMWSREVADGHARRVYDFSVGPWRWIELFWPNVTGQPFPQNHRWLTALSGESRFWTPSLYMGLLPLMLALRTGMKHRSSLWVRWLLLATLLCCIAAIGQHGVGWLQNEVRFQLDGTNFERSKLLPGFGGLYWLMNCILPGFVDFRYPAKLWTIAALGIGILAGKSWPWLFSVQNWRRQKRYFLVWIGINALLACVVFLFASRISDWAASVRPSPLFGPLETSQLARGVAFSFAHPAIIAAFAWVVLAMSRELNWPRVSQSILLLVVAVDLVIAQAGMIQTVPASMWSVDRDTSGTTSEPSRSSLANQTLYRCEPLRTYPRSWRNTSSPSRFQELQESDFQTLMPKHHLLYGARALRSTVPMSSADYDVLWEVGLIAGHDAGEQNYRVPPNEFLELLGASHWFVPSGDVEPDDALIVVDDSHDVVQHLINQRSLPRAWLVQDWQVLTGKTPQTREELLRRTRSVLFDEQGQIRDFRQVAVVEKSDLPTSKAPSDALPKESTNTTAVSTAAPAECAITKDTPERIQIDVNPQTPSLLVLSDQFFPGWDVFVGNESSKLEARECVRVNRVMRGVILSPGETRVEFRYRPSSAYWGLAISGSMWAGLLVICFRNFTARVKQQFGAASER